MIDGIYKFRKEYDGQAEELLFGHPDIFGEDDIVNFRKDLAESLKDNPSKHTLMLLANKELAGIIIYSKADYSHNSYFIEWLIIKKEFEGKGYGSLLVHHTCKILREEGGRHVYLETSNERHNSQTKHFYQKIGFEKVGVLPDYFDHPLKKYRKLEDALLLHKSL